MSLRSTIQRITNRLASLIVLAAIFALPVSAQERGAADAVLGRWDLAVTGEAGSHPSWLEIRLRTERSLMASFVGQFGSHHTNGKVSF